MWLLGLERQLWLHNPVNTDVALAPVLNMTTTDMKTGRKRNDHRLERFAFSSFASRQTTYWSSMLMLMPKLERKTQVWNSWI